MELNENECVLHGEAMIFPETLPADAVEIKASNGNYHIIADSETTGNHHVINAVKGTKFWRSGNKTFMTNTNEINVRCVHPARHNPISLSPGTYQVGEAQLEYDHFAQNLKKVRD
jgi:hypothetical protein